MLDSKDHLFGTILIDLDLEGLGLHEEKMKKANLKALNLIPDQVKSIEIDKAIQLPVYLEITLERRG